MVCKGCKRNKFSFQTFNLLIFPLKKVKDFKLAKIGRKKNINLDLNLYDAFSCEQEVEKLAGENMIYCNFCRQLSPGTHKQDYYILLETAFESIMNDIIISRGFRGYFIHNSVIIYLCFRNNMINYCVKLQKYHICRNERPAVG